MGQGSNILFNVISLIFLALTVIVVIVVFQVASGAMDAPIFAPKATEPPPTVAPLPTMTPTLGADLLAGTATPTTAP